jgi:hypothetical protein
MKKTLSSLFRFSLSLTMGMAILPWALAQIETEYTWLAPIRAFLKAIQPVFLAIGGSTGGVTGCLLAFLKMKERRALSVIRRAAQSDNGWDIERLKQFSRLCFYQVHCAWREGEFDKLKELGTDDFLKELIAWAPPPPGFDKDLVNAVDITETSIVAAIDKSGDSSDQYEVLFGGSYIVSSSDGSSPNDIERVSFKVICKFRRVDGNWRIREVNDWVTLTDILSLKSTIEESNSR